MHCVELRHVDALSLQALDFYAQDAWQLTYVLTGRSPQFSEPVTIEIALSLTKEDVAGQGNAFRLMALRADPSPQASASVPHTLVLVWSEAPPTFGEQGGPQPG